LVSLPNSAGILLHQMDKSLIDEVLHDSEQPAAIDDNVALAQVFAHEEPFSHCILGSLERLLPTHSGRDRVLALELAADLLKNGRGESVEKFRRADVDSDAVNRLMRHAQSIAHDPDRILAALRGFSDAEIAMIAYAVDLPLASGFKGSQLREILVSAAKEHNRINVLAGELMRRKPALLR